MSNTLSPPRTFGVLLATLGALLAGGGIYLLSIGVPLTGSAYFIVAGLGVAFSGILMARGKLAGAWLYAAVFLLMVVWSVVELGGNVDALLPRVALPGLICAYIFFSNLRARLA
jgi:quinoprotein glucose dehydrogenase